MTRLKKPVRTHGRAAWGGRGAGRQTETQSGPGHGLCGVWMCVGGICEHPRTDRIFRSTKPKDEGRRKGRESMGIYRPKSGGGYCQRPDLYVSRIPTTSTGLNHPPYPTSAGLCQWPVNVHDSRCYAIRKAQNPMALDRPGRGINCCFTKSVLRSSKYVHNELPVP
jgi:hypothetical protein